MAKSQRILKQRVRFYGGSPFVDDTKSKSIKILIPYNHTPSDQKALDFAIQNFSHQTAAELTVYHGYVPVPEVDIRNNPIMEKMRSNLAYLRAQVLEKEKGMEEAKKLLMRNGFSEDQICIVFEPLKKDIAKGIIDLVRREGFDVIILNRSHDKVSGFFSGSVNQKVVSALPHVTVFVAG